MRRQLTPSELIAGALTAAARLEYKAFPDWHRAIIPYASVLTHLPPGWTREQLEEHCIRYRLAVGNHLLKGWILEYCANDGISLYRRISP